MSETYTPIEDLWWKTVKIHKISEEGPEEDHVWAYELDLQEPLASWDVYAVWEKERIDSIRANVKKTDVLWEVGAESGWMAALYSKYVTNNMVLVEPTSEFWPGMKAIFDRNGLDAPLASFCGFLNEDGDAIHEVCDGWAEQAFGDKAIDKNKYRNLYDPDDAATVKSISLDMMVASVDCKPDAISIDVEGAELLVLRGAEGTLRTLKPKLWVSVHPDLMERGYGYTKEDLLFFMDGCGYMGELLSVDHEEHFYFYPKGTR